MSYFAQHAQSLPRAFAVEELESSFDDRAYVSALGVGSETLNPDCCLQAA